MNHHNHLYANRRVRAVLDAIVRAARPGEILETGTIADRINNEDTRRFFTRHRVGQFMKAREDLVRVGDGIWVVK